MNDGKLSPKVRKQINFEFSFQRDFKYSILIKNDGDYILVKKQRKKSLMYLRITRSAI